MPARQQELDISHNRIARLPSELLRMTRLLMLNLEGNSLGEDPEHVLERLKRVELRRNERAAGHDSEADDALAMLKRRAALRATKKHTKSDGAQTPLQPPTLSTKHAQQTTQQAKTSFVQTR